jgi:gas vesicle protein
MSPTDPEYFLENSMLGVEALDGRELERIRSEEHEKQPGPTREHSFHDKEKLMADSYKEAEASAILDLANTVVKVQQGESGQELANDLLVKIRGMHAMALAQLQILFDKQLREYFTAPARAEAEYRYRKTLMDKEIDDLKAKHSNDISVYDKRAVELEGRLKTSDKASELLKKELTKAKEELAKTKEEIAKLLTGRNLLME